MLVYSRRQVVLLLVGLGVTGLGMAVGHWRRAHPDLVDRLERFDREPSAPGRPASSPRRGGGPPHGLGTPLAPEGVALSAAPPAARRKGRAAPSGHRLDLNRATAAELTALPGIGRVLAGRIVEAREREGPFVSLEDLRRVRGVRGSTLEPLRPYLTIARP